MANVAGVIENNSSKEERHRTGFHNRCANESFHILDTLSSDSADSKPAPLYMCVCMYIHI